MAYHDDPKGHTPIILGRYYIYSYRYGYHGEGYKLIKHNQTTGICALRYPGGMFYISETKLSNWHILPLGPT